MTRDTVPVLLADDSVERMTAGSGQVRALNFAALRQLPIDNGAGADKQETPLCIPTLEEALDVCREYGMTPLLSVHTVRGQDALRQTLERFAGRYVIVSSRKSVLEAWKASGCARLYRTDALTQRDVRYARKTACGIVADGVRSVPALLREAQREIPLWVENIRSRSVLQTLSRYGVTHIVTDCILPMPKK